MFLGSYFKKGDNGGFVKAKKNWEIKLNYKLRIRMLPEEPKIIKDANFF